MHFYNFVLFVYGIFGSHIITQAFDSEMDNSVKVAFQQNVRYHVAILGKANHSNNFNFLCNGAIVHEKYVVANALCFIDNSGELKELVYEVVAGTTRLSLRQSIRRNIVQIYIKKTTDMKNLLDIALAEVEERFPMYSGSPYSELTTSNFRETFHGKRATVSAYEIERNSEYTLKYAFIDLVNVSPWKFRYPGILNLTQSVGLIVHGQTEQCLRFFQASAGSAIVYNENLVGVVNKVIQFGNRTYACAYTSTSYIYSFIISVINNISFPVVRFRNRQHVL